MYCYKCGVRLEDNTSFCSQCGARQDTGVEGEPRLSADAPNEKCKLSTDSPSGDSANLGAGNKKRGIRIAVACILIAIIAIGVVFGLLFMSPENQAERRYQQFADYLTSAGVYKKSDSSTVSYQIKCDQDGDIECVRKDDPGAAAANFKYTETYKLVIHKGIGTADLSGESTFITAFGTKNEKAECSINLTSYTYVDEIKWDSTNSIGLSGFSGAAGILEGDATGDVADLIRKGLQSALDESNTSTTLRDLGFKNL